MNLAYVTYRITGRSPLLQRNPATTVEPPSRLPKRREFDPEKDAEANAYRLPSGQLYITTESFRAALLGAAHGRMLGRWSARSIMAGALLTAHEKAGLVDPGSSEPIRDYEISVLPVKDKGGKRILRARPKIDKWACEVTFEIDPDFVRDMDVLTDLMNFAGHFRGVGDFRPGANGPYGRYEAVRVDGDDE